MSQETVSGTNPYAPLAGEIAVVQRDSTHTRNTILVMLCATVAYGMSQVFSFDNTAVYIAYSVLLGVSLTHWVEQDSLETRGRFSRGMRLLYFCTCPISTFLYLIKSRGVRGLGWVLAITLGVYGVFYSAYFATFYILYFSGLWSFMDPVFFE